MRIEIISGVCLGPGRDALPGQTHDVVDALGRSLISKSKAREITAEIKKSTSTGTTPPNKEATK